jgi:cyclic pyranopterin phosphate synthase
VGSSNGWALDDVVPSAEIVRRIDEAHPLDPLPASHPGETAKRWRYRDGSGEIGVISSVTGAFCGSCTRARISAEGKLYTCLFATSGTDLRALLRENADDTLIAETLAGVWRGRDDHYSELRARGAQADAGPRIEMSYIGG